MQLAACGVGGWDGHTGSWGGSRLQPPAPKLISMDLQEPGLPTIRKATSVSCFYAALRPAWWFEASWRVVSQGYGCCP